MRTARYRWPRYGSSSSSMPSSSNRAAGEERPADQRGQVEVAHRPTASGFPVRPAASPRRPSRRRPRGTEPQPAFGPAAGSGPGLLPAQPAHNLAARTMVADRLPSHAGPVPLPRRHEGPSPGPRAAPHIRAGTGPGAGSPDRFSSLPPGAPGLLAGHLLLQYRRHQRLQYEAGTGHPPADRAPRRVPDRRVAGNKTGRIIVLT